MSKKVIGALLAIFMVLSVFSFTVFAVSTGYEAEGSTNKQTWGLENKQGSNGTYTVDVVLDTNYKVGPIQFKITGVDSITKVDVNETAYYAAEENHSSSGLVILTPDTSADLLGKELNKAVVATVTYTSSQNGTPAIEENVKSAFNPQGSLMAARLEGSDYVNKATSLVVGQETKVYDLDEEWDEEEPPAGDADLQVKSGVTGVVIDTHKTFGGAYAGAVYGIPAKDGGQTKLLDATYYNDFIQATNGGSLEYVKTSLIARPASWGTGTTVKVKDAAGTVLKTYVLIIIGDVDGDSQITNNDITPALNHAMNPYLPDLQIFAANTFAVTRGAEVNKIASYYTVDNNDISALLAQVMTGSGYDVVKLAEGQQTYNTNYQ